MPLKATSVHWNKTSIEKPKDGQFVEAISESGYQTTLFYTDGLWYNVDKTMYMYWTPIFWKGL